MKTGLLILCAVGAFIVSCLLTMIVTKVAHGMRVLDHPNERSTHAKPTPRLGGIAIALAATVASVGWLFFESIDVPQVLAILLGCAVLASVGVIDDVRSLSARVRLGVQFLVMGGLIMLLSASSSTQLWSSAVVLVATVWFINLFNFMDGIDGFASVGAIFILGTMGVLGLFAGDPLVGGMAIIAACAIAGFLVWNLPPARIFLGDGGSYWIGAFIAVLAIVAVERGAVSLAIAVLLPAPFVADATVCLVRRALRRESVWKAHRMHAYQHANQRWGGRGRVITALCILDLAVLLPAVVCVLAWPQFEWLVVVGVYGGFAILAMTMEAGSIASEARR